MFGKISQSMDCNFLERCRQNSAQYQTDDFFDVLDHADVDDNDHHEGVDEDHSNNKVHHEDHEGCKDAKVDENFDQSPASSNNPEDHNQSKSE